jgi:photosystem II stability/assembly factor-like uncharacterized protein
MKGSTVFSSPVVYGRDLHHRFYAIAILLAILCIKVSESRHLSASRSGQDYSYYSGAVSNDGRTIYLVGTSQMNGETNLLQTKTGGSTYSDISTGIGARFGSVATNDNGQKVVAGADNGVYLGTPLKKVAALPPCPNKDGFAYYKVGMSSSGNVIAAGCLLYASQALLFVSTDSGKTWNSRSTPQGQWQTVSVSNNGKSIIASSRKGQVFISTDSGKSFSSYPFTDGTSTATVSGDGRTWYVSEMLSRGGSLVGNTYKSTDNGKSWDQIDCTGCLLPLSSFSGSNLILVPASQYATGAIAVSTDGGQTIRQSGAKCSERATTIGFSNQGNTMYYTCGSTLFKSTNDGSSWQPLGPN